MSGSRIPVLFFSKSRRDAATWLRDMHARGLLFCLDDKPSDISLIATGEPIFTCAEAEEVAGTLAKLLRSHGDVLREMAAGIVSKTFHAPLERRALKSARD